MDSKLIVGVVFGLAVSFLLAYMLSPTKAFNEPSILVVNQTSNVDLSKLANCNYNIIQEIGNVNRTIDAVNCKTGSIESSSTNSSLVFNYVMTQINLNKGGVVHVTGYNTTHPYNVTTAIILPDKGHLYFEGDGAEFTVLKIPSGSDNNLFQYSGTKTVDAFFNVFTEFEGQGNKGTGGVNNSGFVLNGTSFGLVDSLWENIFLRDFKKYDIYMNNNCWNNKIDGSTIELSGNYGVYITGGLTCQDWKITNSKFLYNQIGLYTDAYMGNVVSNWFYNQSQYALENNGGVGNTITDNRFFDNGAQTNNVYYDVWNLGNDNVITSNNFEGSDRSQKPKYGLFMDTFEHRNVVTGNHFSTSTRTYATATLAVGDKQQDTNLIMNNVGFNPKGLVTTPFYTGTTGIGTTIIPTTGNVTAPRNNTIFTNTNTPIYMTISGGTGVNITLEDNNNNVIQTGLTTITEQEFPFGYKGLVKWATIPTFKVDFQ